MTTLKDHEIHPMSTELIRSRTDPETYLDDFEEETHSSREFLSIKNLDNYFQNIYEYHKQGGYWSIIYSKISNLITILFTISFSVFLIGFINWNSVINCGKSDDECKNVILIQNNISKYRIFGSIVIIYTIVFIFYFLWHLLNFIFSLSSLKITQLFYLEKLQISDSLLRQIKWSKVIEQIVLLQKKTIRLYHNKYLDALDITNRILRKENYIIAFINKGILDFRFPTQYNTDFNIKYNSFSKKKLLKKRINNNKKNIIHNNRKHKPNFKLKFKTIDDENEEENTLLSKQQLQDDIYDDNCEHSKGYLGSVLEWNIRYIIFGSMFDDEMKIRDSFLINSNGLKWKFFWFGIGNLLLTPFTIVFRIIFFFLENAEEMHNNKTDLFSFREWTCIAKLLFREFNELSIDFDKRMVLAHTAAIKYINSFPCKPGVRILSELVSYISGSIVAILLLLTFIDSSILLNIQLFNRSLVWFLAIFSALLAISRSNINNNNYLQTRISNEILMNEICTNTHYFPHKWQNKCDKIWVKNEFMNLYQQRFIIFMNELLSVFTTPFILMFTLPQCVDKLLLFVKDNTNNIDGVGHICSYSRFNFIDENKQKQLQLKDNIAENNSNQSIGLLSPMLDNNRQISDISNISSTSSNTINSNEYNNNKQILTNKKLESSFLTFAINNPKWRSNEIQSIVLQNIIENGQQHINTNHNIELINTPSTPSVNSSKTNKQLGATFSELLQTSQSQYGYINNMNNNNEQQQQSQLFNILQRQNSINVNNNNNNMMHLSEINESDISPSDSSIQENNNHQNDDDDDDDDDDQDDIDDEQNEDEYDAPYKTLLDHQQEK